MRKYPYLQLRYPSSATPHTDILSMTAPTDPRHQLVDFDLCQSYLTEERQIQAPLPTYVVVGRIYLTTTRPSGDTIRYHTTVPYAKISEHYNKILTHLNAIQAMNLLVHVRTALMIALIQSY